MNKANTSHGLLLAAINAGALEAGHVLAETDVTFGERAAGILEGYSASIAVTATEGSAFTGTVEASFNQLDVEEIFIEAGVDTVSVLAGPATVGELVAALNERYDTGFAEEDFNFADELVIADGSTVVTVAPTSVVFVGTLKVTLVQAKEALDKVIVKPALANLQANVAVPVQ